MSSLSALTLDDAKEIVETIVPEHHFMTDARLARRILHAQRIGSNPAEYGVMVAATARRVGADALAVLRARRS